MPPVAARESFKAFITVESFAFEVVINWVANRPVRDFAL